IAGALRFDLRKALVTLQVATSLLLLIGSGLFIRSLSNLESLDPGFVRERVLLVESDPSTVGYKGQRIRDYFERVLERVRSLPNVRAASLAAITPLAGSRWNSGISVEGYVRQPDEKPWVDMNSVSSDYFTTMGIPLLAGRAFRA